MNVRAFLRHDGNWLDRWTTVRIVRLQADCALFHGAGNGGLVSNRVPASLALECG
ncbi:MAG: hypothetical protein Q7T29_15000 [Gallionella sp.]|nr:hypothetical protein [Gallionella sp.]